jgi:hypothetical protein
MNAAIGLRVGSILLDASEGFRESSSYQQNTAEQCWRFIDNDRYFTESQSRLILRAVQVFVYFCFNI